MDNKTEGDGSGAYTRSTQCVMFVEDEEAIACVAGQIFSRLDFEVCVFQDPKKALTAFEKNPQRYAVVVTDQSMPVMSGIELIEQVRAIRPEVPAILCTGLPDSDELEQVLGSRISACIAKPYSFHAVAETIDQLLQ